MLPRCTSPPARVGPLLDTPGFNEDFVVVSGFFERRYVRLMREFDQVKAVESETSLAASGTPLLPPAQALGAANSVNQPPRSCIIDPVDVSESAMASVADAAAAADRESPRTLMRMARVGSFKRSSLPRLTGQPADSDSPRSGGAQASSEHSPQGGSVVGAPGVDIVAPMGGAFNSFASMDALLAGDGGGGGGESTMDSASTMTRSGLRRRTLDSLSGRRNGVVPAPYRGTTKSKESFKRALTDMHRAGSQLLDFQTLNLTGFRKLIKKLPRDMAEEVRVLSMALEGERKLTAICSAWDTPGQEGARQPAFHTTGRLRAHGHCCACVSRVFNSSARRLVLAVPVQGLLCGASVTRVS